MTELEFLVEDISRQTLELTVNPSILTLSTTVANIVVLFRIPFLQVEEFPNLQ